MAIFPSLVTTVSVLTEYSTCKPTLVDETGTAKIEILFFTALSHERL